MLFVRCLDLLSLHPYELRGEAWGNFTAQNFSGVERLDGDADFTPKNPSARCSGAAHLDGFLGAKSARRTRSSREDKNKSGISWLFNILNFQVCSTWVCKSIWDVISYKQISRSLVIGSTSWLCVVQSICLFMSVYSLFWR